MLIFLLQVRDLFSDAPFEIYLFAVFTAIVWAIWFVKIVLSARYRPWTAPHTTTTSVVIPVVDEPLDLFRDVLARITRQHPYEVVVVINGKRNPALEAVCDEFPQVRWAWTPIAGKRNAVKVGVELATGEIIALVDSDTIWTKDVLVELVKPFADSNVGGVTTRQRILQPGRSFLTRWADWLENSRSLYAMPAQSALGQVGCLPGRTIAFRRSILVTVMDAFMHEEFLGVFLEVSDDRTLTNLTLKEGYRTVYQHTSLVYTDAPTQVKKLYKQQLRWARGSQYNTLRMLPWMLGHAPTLAFFFVMDILLPFLLLGAVLGGLYRDLTSSGYNYYEPILREHGTWSGLALVAVLMVVASWLSMSVRQLRHLREKPADFFLLPIFILFSTAFLMPIRIVGFFRMAHAASWGTRADAYDANADVAAEASADVPAPRAADEAEVAGVPVRHVPDAGPGADSAAEGTVLTRTRTVTSAPAPPRARRRRNPLGAVPYAIGLGILALEALAYV